MTLTEKLRDKRVILGSKSPRRKELLKVLDIEFEVLNTEVDETYPQHLIREGIALFLCKLKAEALRDQLDTNTLLITADTIVWQDGQLLGKPRNRKDARRMLRILSGNSHDVVTAVCLMSKNKSMLFYEETVVCFKRLTEKEIRHYIDRYKPFDKAGAYGIQEYLPANAKGEMVFNRFTAKIEGSYSNVVGLPLELLQKELIKFCG